MMSYDGALQVLTKDLLPGGKLLKVASSGPIHAL
jgi:hypothetical protein